MIVLLAHSFNRFRWVFCQLEVLRHCFPANLRRALLELPNSLDETYKRILKEINNSNREHAYRLLQCLAVALRPLRVEELAEVLAFELTTGGIPRLNASWRWEDKEEAVLSACSSLVSVIIEDGSRIVQFSHFSVKEFLTSNRLASFMGEVSQFYIPIEPSHVILAQACLGVLLCLDDRTDKDIVRKIPLCGYAAEYWAEHAQVGNVESQITDAMDYFFDMDNPHFSAWARIQQSHHLLTVSMVEFTDVLRPAAPLYFAAWRGLHGLVERLILKDSHQVNHLGGLYGTPLHASALGGHIDVAQSLVEHGADINSRSEEDWTPLHVASAEGHFKFGKWLLNHGAGVNSKQDFGLTPLHIAAENGHLEVCRMLLQRNAEVNSMNYEGLTPFFLAWGHGNFDIARLLLDHNMDVHVHDNERNTPLHSAVEDGVFDVAQILLERGAEVNCCNDFGFTPLILASRRGNADVALLLLDYNADVHLHDTSGDTPLHFAASFGYLLFCRILLERNAEVDSRDDGGSTPLLLALTLGQSDVAQLLLDNNADVHVHNNNGNIPLQLAARNGLLDITRKLLECNAEVNFPDHHGYTPLHHASLGGYPDVVQLLLEHNADVDVHDAEGNTPLHCAAFSGHIEVSRTLLELNVIINTRNNKGSTPLHQAAAGLVEGSAGVVRLLLDHGADVHVCSFDGETASEVARGSERQEIIQLLSQHAEE